MRAKRGFGRTHMMSVRGPHAGPVSTNLAAFHKSEAHMGSATHCAVKISARAARRQSAPNLVVEAASDAVDCVL